MKKAVLTLIFFISFILIFPLYNLFADEAQIELYTGWNLIGLPLNPTIAYTAESLGDKINLQGGSCERIQYWDGAEWLTHIIDTAFGDYNIEVGKGYFVKSSSRSTLTMQGNPISTLTLTLHPAWNSISIPIAPIGAETAGNQINNEGGSCNTIIYWTGGGWEGHIIGMPFGDFTLVPGQGYFVLSDATSTWITGPFAPEGVTATPGDSIVDLTWSQNLEPDLAGYNVYQSTTSGGPYTRINTSLITETSYTDTGLQNGITYYYVVTAEDTYSNESEFSEEIWERPTSGPTYVSGNITQSTTWTVAASPYIVTSYITVRTSSGSPTTVLTIEPGVEVLFDTGAGIRIGDGTIYNSALYAVGTQADPIKFTSNSLTPVPGDWVGIHYYWAGDTISRLDYVTIEYAGSVNSASLILTSTPVPINNCTIINGSGDGIKYINASSALQNSTVSNHALYGIYADEYSAPVIANCNISNNGSYAISTQDTRSQDISNITATGNGTDAIEIRGGGFWNTWENRVWKNAGIPYIVSSYINVKSPSANETPIVLTMEPGVEVRFGPGTGIKLGNGTNFKSVLYAVGTEANPIKFTSNSLTPAPGDWIGVYYNWYQDTISRLDYVTIEYAGAGADNASLILDHVSVPINNCTVSNGSGVGIYCYSSEPLITYSTISNNEYGVYVPDSGTSAVPTINHSSIVDNTYYNLWVGHFSNASNIIIDARYNWWGADNYAQIKQLIFDNEDNPNSPLVDIYPYTRKDILSIELLPGWNLISFPLIPLEPAPGAVFDELANPDVLSNNLLRWDSGTQTVVTYPSTSPPFGNIKNGEGYKIYVAEALTIDCEGFLNDIDFNYELPVVGKYLFGSSFNYDVAWDSCFIKNVTAGEMKSISEAATAGWIDSTLEGWDAVTQEIQYVTLAGPDDHTLRTWGSYWLTTYVADLELIIPPDVPDITNLTITPNPFSPDEDFVDDEATILFDISDSGYVTMQIYNSDSDLVRRYSQNNTLGPANIQWIWDGRDSGGFYVPNGYYTIIVSAGSDVKALTDTVAVSKYPIIQNYNATPNPFSPDGDGIDDSSLIYFNISEDAYTTIKIYNSASQLVRTLTDNQLIQSGYNEFVWDGKDDASVTLPGGRYTVEIYAIDVTETASYQVSINLYISYISDIDITAGEFNPSGGESSSITYRVTGDTILTIRIYGINDTLVRTLVDAEPKSAGIYAESWDGKNNAGDIAPDGAYYFLIIDSIGGAPTIIFDPRGTGGIDVSHSISMSTTPFNPENNEYCIIDYNLPQPASITIKVREQRYTGPALKVIKYLEPTGAGPHQAIWDGRDEAGALLWDKTYTLAIWGYTLPDKSIMVLGGKPIISDIQVSPIIFNPASNMYSSAPQTTTISYTLSKTSNVTMLIYDENNTLVRTLLNGVAMSQGVNNTIWNGNNDSGIPVPPGRYRVEMQAQSGTNFSDPISAAAEVYY